MFSSGGTLTVDLWYNTTTDPDGRTLYCFSTPGGTESPTLHVKPGDTLTVNVTNKVPQAAPSTMMHMSTNATPACGATMMDASSVNIHYHGTNVSPGCHSDEVIRTLINSSETFTYNISFPSDEPPGLYWYHPLVSRHVGARRTRRRIRGDRRGRHRKYSARRQWAAAAP